jgi:hypothetical protein
MGRKSFGVWMRSNPPPTIARAKRYILELYKIPIQHVRLSPPTAGGYVFVTGRIPQWWTVDKELRGLATFAKSAE